MTDVVSAQLQVTAQRVEAIRQLLEDPTAGTAASSRRHLREHELRPHAGPDARHGRRRRQPPATAVPARRVGWLGRRAHRRRRERHAAAARGDPARLRPGAAERADRCRRRARRRPAPGASRRCRSSAPPSVVPPPSPQGAARVALALRELGVAEDPPGSNDSARIAEYRTATARSGVGPWCAYFTSWVGAQAGTPLGAAGQGEGYVPTMANWLRGRAATSRRRRARRAPATSSSSTGSATASSTTSASSSP